MGKFDFESCNSQQIGKFWEQAFLVGTRSQGLFAEKNELSARRIGKGRIQAVKSDLDYKVITRAGKVAFLDCKTYKKSFFKHSEISAHQISKAVTYNTWKVPAGFVAWFRNINQIYFFSGFRIEQLGGIQFGPAAGIYLGCLEEFNLSPVFGLFGLEV